MTAHRSWDAEARALAAAAHYIDLGWVVAWELPLVEGGALILLEVPEPKGADAIRFLLVHRGADFTRLLVETDVHGLARSRLGDQHRVLLPNDVAARLGVPVHHGSLRGPVGRGAQRIPGKGKGG